MSLTPNCPGECHCQAMLVSKVRLLHQFPSIELHIIRFKVSPEDDLFSEVHFVPRFPIKDHKKLFFETNLCSIQREPWCFIMKPNWKTFNLLSKWFSMFLTSFPIISFSLAPVFCLVPGTEAWAVSDTSEQCRVLQLPNSLPSNSTETTSLRLSGWKVTSGASLATLPSIVQNNFEKESTHKSNRSMKLFTSTPLM